MDVVLARFPNLIFTDSGLAKLAEVLEFLEGMKLRTDLDPHFNAALERDFLGKLRFLEDFGGTMSDTDRRRRFQITLGGDFAPLSFSVTWCSFSREADAYVYSMNGGLIWHGGSNDPLCVTLTPQMWGIHT